MPTIYKYLEMIIAFVHSKIVRKKKDFFKCNYSFKFLKR